MVIQSYLLCGHEWMEALEERYSERRKNICGALNILLSVPHLTFEKTRAAHMEHQ